MIPQDPQGEIQPGTQALRNVVKVVENRSDVIREYLLYRPAEQVGLERWPMLLFLHGRGEGRVVQGKHQGIEAVMTHQTPPWHCRQAGWNYSFLVISPQLPDDRSSWHDPSHIAVLDAILDNVITWYQGDPNRVYATGFSIGGLGVIALAARSRRSYAALLPIDAYDPAPRWRERTVVNTTALGTPVWSHHTTVNDVAPGIVRVINAHPRETLYRTSHVEICRRAYADPAVYDWLLAQERR